MKRNPIRNTVTCFVSAKGKRRVRQKLTIEQFFEDLENRGPLSPNSIFELWTKKIRKSMQKKRRWITHNSNYADFVAEYICLLQREFRNAQKALPCSHNWGFAFWELQEDPVSEIYIRTIRMIYIKVRVRGLQSRQYKLKRWINSKQASFTLLWPIVEKGLPDCTYVIQPYGNPKEKPHLKEQGCYKGYCSKR